MHENFPIDPRECHFELKRISEGHATLDIKIPSKYVRRLRKQLTAPNAPDANQHLRSTLIQFALEHVLKESSLRLVTPPALTEGSAQPETAEFHDFACTLDLDLAVKTDLPDLSGVKLVLPDATVTDELIEAEVASQCLQFGARTSVETLSRGCECELDVAFMVRPGEGPVLAMERAQVLLPAEGDYLILQSYQVAGLTPKLLGMKAGETRTIDGTFPLNFGVPFLRAAPASIRVTVRAIQRVDPAPLEQVIKEYGMPSADRLRTQIRFALEDKRLRDSQVLLRDQMAEALPELVAVEPPVVRTRMLRGQAHRQYLAVLQARGVTGETAKREWEAAEAKIHERADRHARLKLILPSLSQHLALLVDEDLVAGRVAAIAAERGVRPEQVRNEMVQSGRYNEFVDELAAEVALDKLVERCKVETVSAEAWESFQRERNKAD